MPSGPAASEAQTHVGRYVLFDAIASGGMAAVHYARQRGSVGFVRTVAIKRPHAHLANDPEFVAMFLDEARLAARIHHPNVVDTLDVTAEGGELLLVMEYVHGESLSALLRTIHRRGDTGIPPSIAVAIVVGVLHGLHAVHEAKSESGEPLHIVHRDVSPQNVLVGSDGVPRVLDLGVALAAKRSQATRAGQLKGKLAYMSPEQLRRGVVDRRTDVYAASVVLWESLTGRRLHSGEDEGAVVLSIVNNVPDAPSRHAPGISNALDAVVLRGLASDADTRYATALDMADALEKACEPARSREVAAWVNDVASESLARRTERVAAIERIDIGAQAQASGVSDVVAHVAGAALRSEEPTDVHADIAPPARRRRWPVLALVLGGATVAFAAAWLVRRVPPSTHDAIDLAARSSAVSAGAPATPPSLSTTPPSTAATPSSTMPVAPVEAVTVTPPVLSASSRSAAPASARKARNTAKTRIDNCDPGFTVDSAGVKHFKPECL